MSAGNELIPLFAPLFRTDEVLAEVRECLERGWTGSGFKTIELEDAWRKYSGFSHAHFVNSGTAALHTAFAVLKKTHGWVDGDEIITTSFTFVATNHAILYENLRPVFADVDGHLCLSPESVASRITPRTRAVCFVGIGGNPGRYSEVLQFCRERGLKMILDASHMAGTRFGQSHVGLDSDVAVFSFHAVKNLPTADAGMVCFAEPECDRSARRFAWLGIEKHPDVEASAPSQGRYSIDDVGFKYHGNSIVASMALVGLRYLDTDNERRREIAGWYDEALADEPRIERPQMAAGFTLSRHLYQVLIRDRNAVMDELNRQRILTGLHYADNTDYPMFLHGKGSCPNAARAAGRVLSLPMFVGLRKDQVARVVSALKNAEANSQGVSD